MGNSKNDDAVAATAPDSKRKRMGFSAYALVRMADGSEKRAENIEKGDRVADPLTGGSFTVKNVWQGPGVGMFRVTGANGTDLDLTEDQVLVTGGGPVRANQITPGAILRLEQGTTSCSGAERLMGDFMVYDIVPAADTGGPAHLAANGLIAAAAN